MGQMALVRSRFICGIAGFSLAPGEKCNANRLARHLLLGIEHRGRDATGAAWRLDTGGFQVQKKDIDATAFVAGMSVPRKAQNVLLHTRFATQGDPRDKANNHPIATGGIVGVHNGMVYNDHSLFHRLGKDVTRIGEVDSEAIFATLAFGNNLPGVDSAEDALAEIGGPAAVAWLDSEEDVETMHIARICSSPVWLGQTPEGSLLFASTRDALIKAAHASGLTLPWIEEMDEGQHLTVRAGRITDLTKFENNATYLGQYSSGSRSLTPGWAVHGGDGKSDKFRDDGDCPKCGEEKRYFCICDDARLATFPGWDDETGEVVVSSDDALLCVVQASEKDYDPVSDEWRQAYTRTAMLYCGHDIERPDNNKWAAAYADRQEAMDIWAWRLHENLNSPSIMASAKRVHYGVRPGDWVETDLMGQRVWAEVVNVPDTFPHGDYILRCCVPQTRNGGPTDRLDDTEMVLVKRRAVEFRSHWDKKQDFIDDHFDYLFEWESEKRVVKDGAPHVEATGVIEVSRVLAGALDSPGNEDGRLYDLADLAADLNAKELQPATDWTARDSVASFIERTGTTPILHQEGEAVVRAPNGEFISIPNPQDPERPTLVRVTFENKEVEVKALA